MPQGVHRVLVVALALVGCEPPAAEPEAPPSKAIVAAAPAPAPVEPAAPPPEPVEEPLPPPPRAAPELETAAVRSLNALTIDLQRRLAGRPGNLLASGMSLSVALAMVHAGSRGATASELAGVLHLERPAADVHAGYAGLTARWNRQTDALTVVVASRLFGDDKVSFDPAYLDLTRTTFSAPLTPLPMRSDPAGARERINTWVREVTHDKIEAILPEGAITEASRLVLANAMYFKADWLIPFDTAETATQSFFGAAGRTDVPMMRTVQRLPVAFGKAGKLRVLELPYKGGEYSMVIVLPAKRDGLKAIEKTFNADKLQSWLDSTKPISTELRMPRFKLDTSYELAPVLDKLGARRLFTAKKAELGGITSEKLALSAVHHRAQITVEERGTEAAAATAIEVSVGGMPTKPIPFIVDRPFLFYIRDVRTGALLLFGRVTDIE